MRRGFLCKTNTPEIMMKPVKKSELLQRIRQDLHRLRLSLPIFFLYGVTTQLVFHTVCPFSILTGFPCPACGMTRAILLFLTGEFRLSFFLHPMALFWPLLLLYWGYFRYFSGKRAPFVLPLTIILSLATFACYLYRLTAGMLPEVPTIGILHLVI